MAKTKSAKVVSGKRSLTVRVKTSKYRKKSSNQWLERQLNDPYVAEAKRLGYRSRAAFKLIQLDEKFKFLGAAKPLSTLAAHPAAGPRLRCCATKAADRWWGWIFCRRSRFPVPC